MKTSMHGITRLLCGLVLFTYGAIACAQDMAKTQKGQDPTLPGWQLLSVKIGYYKRWFQVYVPEDLPRNAPAVVLLHGGKQNSRRLFSKKAGGSQEWLEVADRDKVLLLVPNGTHPQGEQSKRRLFNWDDLRDESPVGKRAPKDVQFVTAMLDWAKSTYAYDASRVYVTGASNGGMMAYRLLIERPERFAAAAAFIANIPTRSDRLKTPSAPRPLMFVTGTDDKIMPFAGGKLGKRKDDMRSSAASLLWWVEANKADLHNPQRRELEDIDPNDGCRVYETRFSALPGGADVLSYCLHGAGHTMPSIKHGLPKSKLVKHLFGNQCRDVEGVELAWAFLREHKIADQSPGDRHTP